ncbi:MAG: hypothetical protein ISN29_08170 [Gammaproteobacteria bacterium AqS3]|nr:hypothetical protein [Gammaproteobacteria bacterium AqS3]
MSVIAQLRDAVAREPARLQPRLDLIEALRRTGSLGEAEEELRYIVERAPRRHELRFELAKLQYDRRHLLDCLKNTRQLIRSLREESAVWLLHGMTLSHLEGLEEAEKAFRRALKLNENNSSCLLFLGQVLQRRHRCTEAVEQLERACELEPENLSMLHALAQAALADERYEYAIELLGRLIEMGMDDLGIRKNMALCHHRMGQGAQAEKWYLLAQRLSLSDPEAHYSLAMVYLAQGQYRRAWPEYEYRWNADLPMTQLPQTSIPRWLGEDIQGKRILVTSEQGVGDNVQFCRFIRKLQERCEPGHIGYITPEDCADLFAGIDGVDEILPGRVLAHSRYDCYTPLMSLMALLDLDAEDIEAPSPYLKVPAERSHKWGGWFDARLRSPLPKVGIAWTGSSTHSANHQRSIPVEALKPVFEFDRVQWVSLQYEGEAELAAAQMQAVYAPLNVPDGKIDFADTAAIISRLDLLISVDTSVAHIAGALNVPVWTLLSRSGDWRYLYEGDTTPWYPSMRLLRNPEYRSWKPLIEMLGEALEVNFPDMAPKSAPAQKAAAAAA